ncbi:MAG: hypothetical protein ABSC94_19155 [Polyangiaceae bacterium]
MRTGACLAAAVALGLSSGCANLDTPFPGIPLMGVDAGSFGLVASCTLPDGEATRPSGAPLTVADLPSGPCQFSPTCIMFAQCPLGPFVDWTCECANGAWLCLSTGSGVSCMLPDGSTGDR